MLFRYAENVKQILLDNPTEHLHHKKEPRRTHTIPSREQFKALMTELRTCTQSFVPGDAADLVEFLAYSGCRLGEAIEVRWQDLNLKLDTLLITGGDKLTKIPNTDPTTISFSLSLIPPQALLAACKRAGLPRFTHHATRDKKIKSLLMNRFGGDGLPRKRKKSKDGRYRLSSKN